MSTTYILSLYRSILREGKKIPTFNKRQYILKRAKHEFRLFRGEVSAVKIQEQLTFAEDSLDNIKVQAEHLNSILSREPDELPPVEKHWASDKNGAK